MKKIIESNKKAFLVKVPKYLGDQIKSLKDNSIVGTLSVEDDLQIKLINSIFPNEYILNIKPEKEKYAAFFTEDNVIVNECSEFMNITPVMNSEFFAFKKNFNAQKQAQRQIKELDHFAELKKGEKYAKLKEMEAFAKKKKQHLQNKKRDRLDKADVFDLIFKAFEMQTNWTVKDLSNACSQPLAYIQELINEVAVLDKSDHRNTYVLKDQYK